jgi:hypothetical protein
MEEFQIWFKYARPIPNAPISSCMEAGCGLYKNIIRELAHAFLLDFINLHKAYHKGI